MPFLVINLFLFVILSITNLTTVFNYKKWSNEIKIRVIFFVYFLYTSLMVQIYGFFGLFTIFLNILKPPAFHRSIKSKLFIFLILEFTLIFSGYHSILYISFILNLSILNRLLDYDRLFFSFSGYMGVAVSAGKKTFSLLTGPEFCLLASAGASLYATDQMDRDRKIQVIDSKIAANTESIRDLQFRSGSENYADFSAEEKLTYEKRTEALQELFVEKQNCMGLVEENFYKAADILKDIA